MSVENDGRTKEDWYNSDKILSQWGFTDSKCHCCGVDNSNLDGLLMQCAKCRKAYYCSSKCFNEHLPVHNNFCGALPISCDPKGTKLAPLKFDRSRVSNPDSKKAETSSFREKERPPMVKSESNETKASSFNEKEKKSATEPVEKVEEEIVKQPEPEVKEVEAYLDEVHELLEVNDDGDGDGSLGSLQETMSKSFSTLRGPSSYEDMMSKSFSSFGRPFAYISREPEFTKEEIDLRHAEMVQREYSWQTPDWVNSPLKPTAHGKLLKSNGNLASPVTDIHTLVEKGEIGWEKPEWTTPKLRPTPHGEQIKKEGMLAEAPTL